MLDGGTINAGKWSAVITCRLHSSLIITQFFTHYHLFLWHSMTTNWGRGWITVDKTALQAAGRNAHSKQKSRSATDMAREKTVTITVAAHEALKQTVLQLRKLKSDVKTLTQERDQLRSENNANIEQVASLEAQIQEQANEITQLTAQANAQDNVQDDKDNEIEQLKQDLATAQDALAKTGGVDESKLNTELLMHTESTTKTALFRTWKFIENEEDQVNAATALIPYLPVPLDIPENEYITNYKAKINDGLGKGRQYVQSEGKKRAQGMQISMIVGTYSAYSYTKFCCLYLQSGGMHTKISLHQPIFLLCSICRFFNSRRRKTKNPKPCFCGILTGFCLLQLERSITVRKFGATSAQLP